MTRNRLYTWVLLLSVSGFLYLVYALFGPSDAPIHVCIFKNITGYPCPSCGTTRSLIALFHGNFAEAIYNNPMGYVMALVILTVPLWVLRDVLTQKADFFIFYGKIEAFFTQRIPMLLGIGLIFALWMWNIYKAL